MAEVVREEHVHEDHGHGGNNMGMIIGAIVLVVAVILFLFYGLPYLRSMGGGTQIVVPDQVDVNVNQE